MPKHVKKPASEIAESGKERLINAFIKTKKTTKTVASKTSRDTADQN